MPCAQPEHGQRIGLRRKVTSPKLSTRVQDGEAVIEKTETCIHASSITSHFELLCLSFVFPGHDTEMMYRTHLCGHFDTCLVLFEQVHNK